MRLAALAAVPAALSVAPAALGATQSLSTRCSVAPGAAASASSATDRVSFNVPYAGGPTAALADAAPQTLRGFARADFEGQAEDCTANASFQNLLTVGTGTSGLPEGTPVTLLLHVTFGFRADGGGSGAPGYLATLDASSTYRLRDLDELECGEGCRPKDVAGFSFGLDRSLDASPGSPFDSDGSLLHDLSWSWDLTSDDASPQGDSARVDEVVCAAWPCATVPAAVDIPVGTRTISFSTKVGHRISISGGMNVFPQAAGRAGAQPGSAFSLGDELAGLHAAIDPAPGFAGLALVYELGGPPPPPPPPSGPCILVEPATSIDLGTARFSTYAAAVTLDGSPAVEVESCSDALESVSVRGTDAVTDGARWELSSSSANPCSLGPDVFELALGSFSVGPGAADWARLDPGGSKTAAAHLTMPCGGSGGAGRTLTAQLVFTAAS